MTNILRQRWFVYERILKDNELEAFVCAVPNGPYDSTTVEALGTTHRREGTSIDDVRRWVWEKKPVFTATVDQAGRLLGAGALKEGAPLVLVLKTEEGPGINLNDLPVHKPLTLRPIKLS